ncbi:hypothetical protein FUAX_41700 (plasmid) [Fulvitalea axinellae]|uniref:Mannosyl-glycoprotein endo-beta-N-acetylglucosaminidase n=1 Tax=Fulvitalea axinellae TaxID=1182444 RepID=A0AAU9D6V0_9BACT|nr:hypothetical protein FUAX_41700 [Fulvitalea axinellae]
MRKTFLLFFLCVIYLLPIQAQDYPQSKDWFFKKTEFQNWSPASESADPDIEFHISRVPLKERFQFRASQADPSIDPNRRMGIWSGLPENVRGSNSAFEYAFSAWQYTDVFARWNGGGKRITIPPASHIEAAHRNGTQMLGNIIWAWGDNSMQEHTEMVRKENGVYVNAVKLVEMAKFYGFDGWAFNVETTTNVPKEPLVLFMQAMREYATSQGLSNFRTLWYDARSNAGSIRFTEELTSNNDHYFDYNGETVSDVFFLNYNWYSDRLDRSISRAKSLGRDPYDVHAGIYTNGNRSNYADLGRKEVSICLWLESSNGDASDTPLEFMNSALKNTSKVWAGPNGDPSRPGTPRNDSDYAAGYSFFIADRSAIKEYPFVTRFNTGSGVFFSVAGDEIWEKEWSDVSLQDVLPTWRWWWSQGGQNLKTSIYYEDAYEGGASVRINGDVSGENVLNLYKVKLPVSQATELALTYKLKDTDAGAASGLEVGVAFENGSSLSGFTFHPVGNLEKEGWNTKTVSLAQHAGQTMAVIALKVSGSINDYDLRLGELSLTDGVVDSPASPTAINVASLAQTGDKLSAKLTWSLPGNPRYNEDADVSYFEVYQTTSDGKDHFIGRSVARAFIAKDHKIQPDGGNVNLKVVSVGMDGKTKSAPINGSVAWDPEPEADFATGLALQGLPVEFTNESNAATTYEWTFEGGTPATSTDANPQVTYSENGTYTVALKAKHADGTRESVLEKKVVVVPQVANNTLNSDFEVTNPNPEQGERIDFNFTGNPGLTYGPTSGIDVPAGVGRDQSSGDIDLSGGPLTISFWIRRDSWQKDYQIFMGVHNGVTINWKYSAVQAKLHNAGAAGKNLGRTSNRVVTKQWTHLALVYDGVNLTMYQDGEAVSTRSDGIGFGINAKGRFYIGSDSYKAMNFVVDEIRFWKEARTAEQVKEFMFKEIPAPYPAALAHYWPLDENSGNTATDVVGNNTIQMNNISWTTGSPYVQAVSPVPVRDFSYEWTFDGAVDPYSEEASPRVRYMNAGTYPVSLKITTTGGVDVETKTGYITVGEADNVAPVAVIAGEYSPKTNTAVTFSSEGTVDSDGTVAGYAWDFGDGNSSTDANPTHTYTIAGDYTVSLTVTDNEGATASVTKAITVTDEVVAPTVLAQGGIVNISESWTTVNLDDTYSSMVVVATPVTEVNASLAPFVVRIRNASGSSFEIKLQSTGTGTVGTRPVHYLAVEEGDYTEAEHGVKMSAQKVTSTKTAYKWNYPGKGEQISLAAFSSPVVVGQVMTYNDSRWSVFYSDNGNLGSPTSSVAYIGKHVGAGPDTDRQSETVGYIVMESGTTADLGKASLKAGIATGVTGFTRNPNGKVYSHNYNEATGAVASISGMSGSDGAWANLVGTGGLNTTSLTLALDEDQVADTERKHSEEIVSYIVFADKSDIGVQQRTSIGDNRESLQLSTDMAVWPNPATDQVNISLAGDFSYTLYSQNGATISSRNANGEASVDVNALANGFYVLKIIHGNETAAIRVLKK